MMFHSCFKTAWGGAFYAVRVLARQPRKSPGTLTWQHNFNGALRPREAQPLRGSSPSEADKIRDQRSKIRDRRSEFRFQISPFLKKFAGRHAEGELCFRFFSDPRLRLGRPTHISDFRSCECESRPHDCGNGSGATVGRMLLPARGPWYHFDRARWRCRRREPSSSGSLTRGYCSARARC